MNNMQKIQTMQTMQIQPLQPWHLHTIELQDAQADMAQKVFEPAFYTLVTSSQPAYALIHQTEKQDGSPKQREKPSQKQSNTEVLVCYGIQQLWQGRGMVWALLSKNAGRYMRQITWMAKAYLQSAELPRIEAYVLSDFKAGLQWVRLLNFKHEGHMDAFFENGQAAEMYAYLK